MAKKLNKKIAVIGIVLLVLMIAAGCGLFVALKIRHSPDRAYKLYQQALEAGDYVEAETQLGRSYYFGKTDAYKVERLFELADFHLIQNDQHEANWSKAMGGWKEIVKIDPENVQARKALFDYYYTVAEGGNERLWGEVKENSIELIEAIKAQGDEPDIDILIAQAKALLSIAQRGETTDRREPLDECFTVLNQLIEKEPHNAQLYSLMADATMVQGELDALSGIIDAQKKAQEKVQEWLENSVEKADDKATATADLMLYKLKTVNDPNDIEAVRAEIEQRIKLIQPNDKLWLVTSMAYETSGGMSAEAEVNQAIEAIRRAHELKPESFEYVFRMARLMYRKGRAFNDSAALDDALQLAEDALSLEEVQDVPGPLQSRSINYRFTLNNFLTDLYLERALAAKEAGQTEETEDYIQKAEKRIGEIVSTLGVTDNLVVQKHKGLLALAKGQEAEATRLLYKCYEQARALDKTGERITNADSRVCIALARIAEQQGQLGLQNEFLQAAYSSKDRYILQNPQIILDYANVLKQVNAWNIVLPLVQQYQVRYGANEQAQQLEIEACIALNKFEEVEKLLSSYELTPAERKQYKLNMVYNQIVQLRKDITSLKEQGKEPTSEKTQEIKSLRESRNGLLTEVLNDNPKELSAALFAGICVDLIQSGQRQLAVQYLDTFLDANPDVLSLMVLRLKAQQEDPLNLTREQEQDLRLQAVNSLTDVKQKVTILSEHYRSQGEFEKAIRILEDTPGIDPDDPDIVQAKFDVVVEQKDFETAERLLQVIRAKNIDKYEGKLAATKLEVAKENYESALRRLEECLAVQPLSSYIYYLRSKVLLQLGNEEESIENARKCSEMNPKSTLYARYLASLLFDRYAALGSKATVEQQAEVERAVVRAMLLSPSDPSLQSVYAEIIRLRDPDQALSIRQKLMENNPNASNALMLGRMALEMAMSEWDPAKKTGLIELAGKAYQKGMEVDPDNQALLQAYADYRQKTGEQIDPKDWFKGDKNLEWKFYLRNGQYEEAEAILKNLLQEKPDDPLLIQGLVLVSQVAGNRDQVKEYLDVLSEKDDTKDTGLWILQKYIDNGFTVEAEKKLASFRERFPDEKAAMLVQAWVQMGKGQLNEALTQVNRYLETDTNNSSAWRLRGRLYRLMNQPRKAIEDLQHSKNIQDTPAVRMELATVYTGLNQTTAAIGELVSSLEDPQSPVKMRMMLENLYGRTGRMNDLEKLYQSTLEKYPKSVFWNYRTAMFYLNQKKLDKAQELSKAAWQISQELGRPDPGALETYLNSLLADQKNNEALSIASSQIDSPLAPLAYNFMARIYFVKGQKEKAIESFYAALDKAATNDRQQDIILRTMLGTVGKEAPQAWISKKLSEDNESLSACLLGTRLAQYEGSYNEAIEYADKCINIVGEQDPAWLSYVSKKVNLLLMAYVKTSDRNYLDRSMVLVEKMLELQPNNPSLLNNMAYLLADNDQKLETAIEYARRVHQSDPGNPTYLDTYAYVQCKMQQFEEAEKNLIQAIQIYEALGRTAPWDFYKHFGMAREGLGKTEQAVEMYQKAIDSSEIPPEEKEKLQEVVKRLQQTN